MADDIQRLHSAVATIMRALKIAETNSQAAHREYAFVPADIQTMRFLATHEGSKLSDLAQHLGVVPTTASSVVDRLVERGFVLRDRPETNRRAIALGLTEEGQLVFQRIEAEERETMKMMLEALENDSDRAQFVNAMARIADVVSQR